MPSKENCDAAAPECISKEDENITTANVAIRDLGRAELVPRRVRSSGMEERQKGRKNNVLRPIHQLGYTADIS